MDFCKLLAYGFIPKVLLYQRTNVPDRKIIHENLQHLKKEEVDLILSNYSSLMVPRSLAEDNPNLEYCYSCDTFTPNFLMTCLKCQN
mmetsp:Transcript_27364/g.41618  ORF Transcript_27364/g.41618 Transcript_27364/m.41618 type:complete len:87 (+) Transcript_27364:1477-1737(+)